MTDKKESVTRHEDEEKVRGINDDHLCFYIKVTGLINKIIRQHLKVEDYATPTKGIF